MFEIIENVTGSENQNVERMDKKETKKRKRTYEYQEVGVCRREKSRDFDAYTIQYGGMRRLFDGGNEFENDIVGVSFLFANGEVHEVKSDGFTDLIWTNPYRKHRSDYEKAIPTYTFSTEDFAICINKEAVEKEYHYNTLSPGTGEPFIELIKKPVKWVEFYIKNYSGAYLQAPLRCSVDVNYDGRCAQMVRLDKDGNVYLVISNKMFGKFFSVNENNIIEDE